MILVRVELVGYISEIGVEERANRPSISYKLLLTSTSSVTSVIF